MQKRLSITIPCYNEADNIPNLLERLKQAILRDDIEIVIVDNGSTDNTAEVLQELLPAYWFARSIHVRENQGYGYGIYAGLKSADSMFIGWTHGDLQTDPFDIIRAFEILERIGYEENTYVKGARVGRDWKDSIFSAGMGFFASLALKMKLYEINAQPNIFHRNLLSYVTNPPKDFSLDLYVYYKAKLHGYKMKRFTVSFKDRIFGMSNWNTGIRSKIKFALKTIQYILYLRGEMMKSQVLKQ